MGEVCDNEEDISTLSIMTLPEIEEKLDMNPQCVKVSYVDSPSNFFIQKIEQERYLLKFQQNLNDFYKESHSPPTTKTLPIGSCWGAYFAGAWHRVKVICNTGVRATLKDTELVPHFECLLLDSGRSEVISLTDITTLDKSFCLDPAHAIPCCLAEVFPGKEVAGGFWSNEAKEFFAELVNIQSDYMAIFIDRKLSLHYEVILENPDGQTLNEVLIHAGLATSSISEVLTNDNLLRDLQSLDIKCNTDISTNTNNIDIPDEWNPMKEDYLNPDSHWLDNEDAEMAVTGFKNENNDKICKYIRFGKTCPRGQNCPFLHCLPNEDDSPVGSVPVCTDLYSMQSLPTAGSILESFLSCGMSPSQFYLVFTSGADEDEEPLTLLQEDLYEYYSEHKSRLSRQYVPALGELMVVYNEQGALMGWHRVRIVDHQHTKGGEVFEVFYIDVGHKHFVKETQLQPIETQFLHLPQQAVAAYLDGIQPSKGTSWSVDAMKCFRSMYDGRFLQTKILRKDRYDDRLAVKLSYLSEENVKIQMDQKLVAVGHAKRNSH